MVSGLGAPRSATASMRHLQLSASGLHLGGGWIATADGATCGDVQATPPPAQRAWPVVWVEQRGDVYKQCARLGCDACSPTQRVVRSAWTGTCTGMPPLPTREAVTVVRQGMNQLAMRSPSALHSRRWATQEQVGCVMTGGQAATCMECSPCQRRTGGGIVRHAPYKLHLSGYGILNANPQVTWAPWRLMAPQAPAAPVQPRALHE